MHGLHQRLGVNELRGVNAGEGAARDVARDVAARAGGREADSFKLCEDGWHVLDADVVELYVLARRHVAGVPCVSEGELAERLKLLARQRTIRHLDAQHEVAFILRALRVKAVPAQAHVEVVLGYALEALAGVADDVFQAVEPVAHALGALHLVLFSSDGHGRNLRLKQKLPR